MKEIENILKSYEEFTKQGIRLALATVIKVSGSSYRSPGARMLLSDSGRWVGSISGGCLEGDALRKARKVMKEGVPALVTYDTRDDESGLGLGLGCNGIIDVLLEPVTSDNERNPVQILREFSQSREPSGHALVYDVRDLEGVKRGDRVWINSKETHHSIADSRIAEIIGDRLNFHRGNRSSRTEQVTVEEGQLSVFLEVIEPPLRLLIFGGGFDVKPVTELASQLGWEIAITEECIAHTIPVLFPKADQVAQCNANQILSTFEITPYTAAVVMSHNYTYDKEVLSKLLTRDIRYVGVLGPRSRFDKMIEELQQEGHILDPERVDKVNSPVGLDIGAETPDEIALSIVAEIKAIFSGRAGQFLNERDRPIHERDNDTEEIYKPRLSLQ